MFNRIKKSDIFKISLILLVLTSSVVFLYSPHFKIKFSGYDVMELYKEVQERNTLKKIIDYKYFSEGGGPSSAYFNPVILLVWRHMVINYDKNPYPYHFLCTLIHIINTIIAFFLLKTFIKNNFFSFAAALSFAIYYLNFKTIEWIGAGIAQGLTTFFILSTLFLAIKYFQIKNILYNCGVRSKCKNKFLHFPFTCNYKFFYLLSLLTFFLGIFTKEYVLFVIPIIVAYYFLTQRKKIFKIIKPDVVILPYLILSLPIISISLARMNNSAVVTRWGGLNLGIHMVYRFIDFLNYLITVVPVSFNIQMAIAVFILLSFPALIYYGLKNKNLLFLIIWLVLLISIYIYSNFRDIYSLGRYLYLPSVAWFGLLYYIVANIKNLKMKIISSFCLINYTIILNLFLILIKR